MTNTGMHETRAVITGATTGIGRATAELFAKEGADVVIGARSTGELEEVATSLTAAYDSEVTAVPVDVSDEEAVTRFVDSTAGELGGIDVAVHSAGTERAYGSPVDEVSSEDYRAMMDTNVDGTFYLTHEVVPFLRESSGALVLLASFAGQYPRPASPVYAATKWWVRGFGRSVQAEVGTDDVAVSIINPSEVRTGWQGAADAEPLEEVFAPDETSDPEEIAEAIQFVATRKTPNTVVELDMYRRDKLHEF